MFFWYDWAVGVLSNILFFSRTLPHSRPLPYLSNVKLILDPINEAFEFLEESCDILYVFFSYCISLTNRISLIYIIVLTCLDFLILLNEVLARFWAKNWCSGLTLDTLLSFAFCWPLFSFFFMMFLLHVALGCLELLLLLIMMNLFVLMLIMMLLFIMVMLDLFMLDLLLFNLLLIIILLLMMIWLLINLLLLLFLFFIITVIHSWNPVFILVLYQMSLNIYYLPMTRFGITLLLRYPFFFMIIKDFIKSNINLGIK